MNRQGYKVVSLKGEVIEEIRKRAKEEDKTLSAFLKDVLKQVYSNKKDKEYSNVIAIELKEQIEALKKATCSINTATQKREEITLSLKDKEDIDTRILEAVRTAFKEMR